MLQQGYGLILHRQCQVTQDIILLVKVNTNDRYIVILILQATRSYWKHNEEKPWQFKT